MGKPMMTSKAAPTTFTVEDESERVVLIVDVGAQAISAALLVVASRVLRDYM